jgi:hypothetical protein
MVMPGAVDAASRVGIAVAGAGEELQTWEPLLDKLRVFVDISKTFEEVSTAESLTIYDFFICRI